MPRKLALLGLLVMIGGCGWHSLSSRDRSYETIAADPRRDSELARRMNAEGARHIQAAELDQAEACMKAALKADLFFAPAHNNLGIVYFQQNKFYLAAWEFQYAIKMMPNNPQPKNNMGLVFEAVGRLDDAAKQFDQALSLEPDNVEYTGNLARACVRANRMDEKTRQLLADVVAKDTRPEWVVWARGRLIAMPANGTSPATQPGSEN